MRGLAARVAARVAVIVLALVSSCTLAVLAARVS